MNYYKLLIETHPAGKDKSAGFFAKKKGFQNKWLSKLHNVVIITMSKGFVKYVKKL